MEEKLSLLIREIKNIKEDIDISSIIGIGAEAILVLANWLGYNVVVKYRYSKKYRDEKLDFLLRKKRTINESRIMIMCKKIGIPVPSILYIDDLRFLILMEYINGIVLRDINNIEEKLNEQRIMEIGRYIGLMHENNIIHGDLTLANIVLTNENRIFFIDFGLSEQSSEVEKQGVDIHILMRSVESILPFFSYKFINKFFEGYKEIRGYVITQEIKEKIKEIRRRGRYIPERRQK